eukprot:3097448-Pyramimonas_sp.AAC.1
MIVLHREAHYLPLGPKISSIDMARRSRDDLLLLELPSLRYNRIGYGLRLRRSFWLGLPPPFKFVSGAGLWWSTLALLSTIHGTMWWIIDMVEHQGAVGLRGGMCMSTHNRKDSCS